MKSPLPTVQVSLTLPLADVTAYTDALCLLNEVMGRRAPDIVALMTHTLRCRDGRGLAEDYLESIHWTDRAAKAARRRQTSGKVNSTRRGRTTFGQGIPPPDPGRN